MSGLHRRSATFQGKSPGLSRRAPGFLLGSASEGADAANTAPAIVANQLYLRRFVPDEGVRITGVKVFVATADGADPAVAAALYSPAGVRLATSGAVTGKVTTANGWSPEIAFTSAYQLEPGDVYYIGVSFAAAVQTVRQSTITHQNEKAVWGTTTLADILFGIWSASHPPPANLASTTPDVASNATPHLAVLIHTDEVAWAND